MRTTLTMAALFMTTMLLGGTAGARTCNLKCEDHCRQEAGTCNATALLTARMDKFACEADAAALILDCEGVALGARTGCLGLCGREYQACNNAAQVDLKMCKDAAKADRELCKTDVEQTLGDDKALCADDLVGCLEFCSNPVVVQ
jgi:hypothetical protein